VRCLIHPGLTGDSQLVALSDGGGIRGLSELLILREIMKRIQYQQNLANTPLPCEHFDMIGGTSTGGCVFATSPQSPYFDRLTPNRFLAL
jgi:patatin-like phospholipase/acyl hydrolase